MPVTSVLLPGLVALALSSDPVPFEFQKGDNVCLLGNALAERMQHHGSLETRLQLRFPDLQLSFRNLGFSADELTVQQRTSGFGSWDDYLTRCQADVIFAFFGFNESFAGVNGVSEFRDDLTRVLEGFAGQKYNGASAPRVVLFAIPPFENTGSPYLPDGGEHNVRIQAFNAAMAAVASSRGVPFVDLYTSMAEQQSRHPDPLTLNGVFHTRHGNDVLARVIERQMFGAPSSEPDPGLAAATLEAVLHKNLLWFNRYRATDGFNVYGGRSSLKYTDNLSNYDVLQREMHILDAMADNGDRQIWARARGDRTATLSMDGVPEPIPVKTNIPGPLPDGRHEFVDGEQAIEQMTVAPNMKINLFADEKQFPEIANPVQMAWDTRGRLWVAAWPTYPHWAPGEPMNDKLVILEDKDGDGRADHSKVFAGDLHNPTGFEFWNGGVVVANTPDLLFLEDTDGDDQVDRQTRILHGLSSADTHHAANSFVLGPGGALYFQEGTFHMSQVETTYGPERCHNGCVWRFEPRTFRAERYVAYNFANPHGHVFDRWGQDFVTDGTGNVNYYALPFSGRVVHPDKHRGYFPFFKQRSRPCAGTEILSSRHFPEEHQGNYLICNVIGFRGIFQYEVHDDGSGFRAEEVAPIVHSSDPRFRPADVEVGPDGAIYFLDWYNPIIGHMQHHLRDPNRDREHGRVYRVTYEGRRTLTPIPIADQPVDKLVELLGEPEDRVRYRARIELSERDADEVLAAVMRWVEGLDPTDRDIEHHFLEALWMHQHHHRAPIALLDRVLRSTDPRARAAATRVIRGLRHQLPDALQRLKKMAGDPHPRVRLEAVVAASSFDDAEAATVALEALRHPTDRFLDYALNETMRTLAPFWKAALTRGESLAAGNPAGVAFLLDRVSDEELHRLPRMPIVYQAMMTRHGVTAEHRREAAEALARDHGTDPVHELLEAVRRVDRHGGMHARHVLHDLGMLLQKWMSPAAPIADPVLQALALEGKQPETRQLAMAAIARQDGGIHRIHQLGLRSPEMLQSFLGAIPLLESAEQRASAYEIVRPIMFQRPSALIDPDQRSGSDLAPGVRLSYFGTKPNNAELETLQAMTPDHTLTIPTITLNVPELQRPDAFGMMYEGTLHVPEEGEYTLFLNSDDGSHLYLDGRRVIDNGGTHGMRERSTKIQLARGPHPMIVTYYDNGGGEGLVVSWQRPGEKKQPIPGDVLTTSGGDPVRVAAVRAMTAIPGHEEEKLRDAAKLIGEGVLLDSAVILIEKTPADRWPAAVVEPLITSIAAYASALPAEQRTLPGVIAALDMGKKLADSLPEAEAARAHETLAGLTGSTVLIRTVPHQMLYDRTEFWVEAGKPVAVVFQNNDVMPHNLVITRPGQMESVSLAAEAMGADAATASSDFIPPGEDVLWAVRLLYPGETADLRFVAPEEPGEYPYVCTFPGHWRVMNGVMHVVEKLEPDANRVTARTAPSTPAPARRFVKMWTPEDLKDAFGEDWVKGRSLEQGRSVYQEAGCMKCHWFQGEGVQSAPDLTEVRTKYKGMELLRHVLEPSKTILEGYENHVVFTLDGKTIIGRITKNDASGIHVVPNLQEPDKIEVIAQDNVELTKQSSMSAMPTGLLVTFNQDEILDLIAYLQSPPE